MASLAEAGRALEGAIAIIRRDPDAARHFDLSIDGFWRSFGAIVFIAPIYLIFVAAQARLLAESDVAAGEALPSGPVLLLSEYLTLGVAWLAYPLAMYFFTRSFGLAHRYVAYVVVYNWSSLLVTLVMVPPFLLYVLGVLPLEPTLLLNLVTVAAALGYRWLLAVEVLGAPAGTAAAIVVLDVVLSLFIEAGIAALIGV